MTRALTTPLRGQLLDQFGDPLKSRRRAELSRNAGRVVRGKYDAAQTNRENERHWQWADSLSADAAANPAIRRILRNRGRYEAANNSYCAGMIQTLANDTIGSGPQVNLATGNDSADSQVESRFKKWTKAVRLPRRLRTMRKSKARDGESFAAFVTNFVLHDAVKLDLRVYEADQIAAPLANLTAADLDGIVLDDFGNVAGYHMLLAHPGSTSRAATNKTEVVAARDMLHVFNEDRAGQHRGVPEITPALPLYAQLRRYTLAVIAAAETAADMAAVIKSTFEVTDPAEIEEMDLVDIERRMMLALPAGYDIEQLKAEQPTTTYEMFKRAILQEIARCLNMPYNVAAGDSSSYNYASGRMDHQVYFKSIQVERSDWEIEVLDRVFARWWEEARLVDGYLPDELRNLGEPPEHEWRWDGREHVDPAKEANAQATRLASFTTTLADEWGRAGGDWEEKLRQRARELGITFEQLQQLMRENLFGGTAPTPDDQDDDEEEDKRGNEDA